MTLLIYDIAVKTPFNDDIGHLSFTPVIPSGEVFEMSAVITVP